MDTSYEDKMYRQIEKSLSNNINDKLFVPIEMINKPKHSSPNNKQIVDSVSYEENLVQKEPLSLYNYKLYDSKDSYRAIDEYKDAVPRMSRAEYILQAREACLRQMNVSDTGRSMSDVYTGDDGADYSSYSRRRRGKVESLFNNGDEEEVLPEEMASFKSLIIRTVCAAAVFITIFLIDKIKVDWGVFSYETIRHYVTGNNQLKALEELIVSLLK